MSFGAPFTARLAAASRDCAPRRQLGVGTATAVVIASMVGSGIFTTSGFIARDVGSPTWLMGLWVAGGAVALAGALSYGELAGAMPEAGGEYVYLREAYGPLVAYFSGWTSFVAGFSGALAAATLAFVGYLHELLPLIAVSPAKLIALAVLWALTAAHAGRVRAGGRVQRALTTSVVGAIVALVAAAFLRGHGSSANFFSSAPAHGSAAVSLIFVLYAYSGWNAAAYLAGEIRAPQRNVPRALVGGTAIVAVLYLAMNATYLYALPIASMSGVLAIADKACAALFGAAAAGIISGILALAILASASAMVMAGPRVYYAMARDGLFPRGLSAIHPVFGTPARAILMQSLWASVLILFFGTFERLVVYTGFAVTIFSALAVAGLIVLRFRRPEMPRPFRTPGYPWLPATYVAVSAWVVVYALADRPIETMLGLVTIAAGVPFYLRSRGTGTSALVKRP